MLKNIVIAAVFGVFLCSSGMARAEDDGASLATMTVSDLGALFRALTDGMSGPLVDELRREVQEASEAYDNASVFSGGNPDGTQTWNGEIKYYPLSSIFDTQITVSANDYIVDDVDNLFLNGNMDIRIAGFWNPVYNGLTSVGFPYITYFSVDGEIASSGMMEESLEVSILIDGTKKPVETVFVVNGVDVIAKLKAKN